MEPAARAKRVARVAGSNPGLQPQEVDNNMHPTDLTVAAVVKHDSRYLLVEERAMGLVYSISLAVISKPANRLKTRWFAKHSKKPVAASAAMR